MMSASAESFNYADERFADIQLLRYRLDGFEQLPLEKKMYIYCLSQAALWGRDITFDQFGRYNLKIRKVLETVVTSPLADRSTADFKALEVYLKRVWFSSGIHHHYGQDKFMPDFSEQWFRGIAKDCLVADGSFGDNDDVERLVGELAHVMFDPEVDPKRVNHEAGCDLVVTSACNYYQGVTQQEAERFYGDMKAQYGDKAPSFGLNSRLVKNDEGKLEEQVWRVGGMYGKQIEKIVYWLEKAREVAENNAQRKIIGLLVDYYRTGDLGLFDQYSIEWVRETEGDVDFINGFIEVYGDPLGFKGSWEGLVEYKDEDATRRTMKISQNAQWFEDHSPVDPRFRKAKVKGVTAKAICAAMLGGDEYPSTAIGINLPNADWIRSDHGSKSITISNITAAYGHVAKGNGMLEEFVVDDDTVAMIRRYGDLCDELHTDLHECLGHGSGQLLPGVSPDALKSYGSTIEEARADLFGLYYIADAKLVELGLLDSAEAYKAHYYTYMMNGLMTQLPRIKPGHSIEEAHMRNRALIARWCVANGNAARLVVNDGKTFLVIDDYETLRRQFAELLAEIQRIKSEGDHKAARDLVETYGVKVDPLLHEEILARYTRLDIAPYKGFINPVLIPRTDNDGNVVDVAVDYSESYSAQMLRYGREYSA
ncbi:MAG: dihydrofolate reductase [Prevotellaceae bacterium]|nr:dihydrofolate reductase [Prevotellaceae bacterium]